MKIKISYEGTLDQPERLRKLAFLLLGKGEKDKDPGLKENKEKMKDGLFV